MSSLDSLPNGGVVQVDGVFDAEPAVAVRESGGIELALHARLDRLQRIVECGIYRGADSIVFHVFSPVCS